MELLAPGTELDSRELEVLDEVAGTPVVVGAGIGEAPHGYLYRAEVGETPVQLMVYDPRMLQSQDARLALLEGVDQATSIEHSGIVPTFGLLEAPGSLASLRGDPGAPSLRETLHQRMAQGRPIDPTAAIDVALQLCDVLAALHDGDGHEPGMVHAYVTADTVYVSDLGRVRLGAVGEGLALPYAPGFQRFHTAGLLPMVAPELRQDPSRAVPGTDVYGVATLLVELLTGRPVEMPGASLRAMGVPGPPMLVAALQRAIAPDPSARPPDCRSLGAELASASGRSTSSAPPPLPAAGAGAPPPPPPSAGSAPLPPPPPPRRDSAADSQSAPPPPPPPLTDGTAGPPPPPPAGSFAAAGDDSPLPPPPPSRLHSNTPTNLRQQRFPGATASGLIRLPSNTPSGLLPRPSSAPPTPPRPLRPADSLTARIEASDLATVSMSSGMRPSASGRFAQPRSEPQASVSDAEWAALDRATRQLEEAEKGDTHLFDPLPDAPDEPAQAAAKAPAPPPAAKEKSDLNLDLDEFDQAASRLTTVDGESGLLGLADGARSPGRTEEDSALIALRDRAQKAKDGTHFGSFADDSGARPVSEDSGLIRDLEVSAPRSAASERAAGRFVVRRRGVDEGPYTLSQLEDLIQAQQLASTDTVVRMGEDRERLAVDYEHLRPLFESRIELEVSPVASRSQARGPAVPPSGRPAEPQARRGGGTMLLLLLALLVFGGAAAYLYLMNQGGL